MLSLSHSQVSTVSRQSWQASIEPFFRALLLFTKSDVKTIVFPVTVFAYLSAPSTSIDCLLAAIVWTWLGLLQFCVSNQTMNFEEDMSNKPWRPIPSQLIDVPTARMLRWILLPICLVLSIHDDVFWPGVGLSVAFLTHNELDLGSHWFLRSVCNSWGYAMFNAGAANIALPDYVLDQHTVLSVACNALIILTTIHAQDFRDQEGDKLSGRRTLPILFPEASRISILVLIVGWTIALNIFFGFHLYFAVPYTALSMAIGLRFHRRRSMEDDRCSYMYYNVCDIFLSYSAY
ncbi:hypothetical protein EW146_g250 [Bondarzewia mesenterica]|uniref:UbiA prenyltransferase n=1 Tax=Bondarzewia mesenterica TaxID=1095465 RepID=A0A4S4MDW5_9AGAM|nr:hypothetical protein EW146_g250 [Bondarzewia mesenterica]